jgi:tripartite ATP-independent transporter DctM subunit
MLCFGFMAVCYFVGRIKNYPRVTRPISAGVVLRELAYASPALGLPVLIVVFLRFGIATPTEVSVISTLYAGLVSGLLYRDLTIARVKAAVIESGVATGVVLLVIMASSAMGWIITFEQLPVAFADFAKNTLQEPWLIILAMNIIMLLAGMFIDLPAAVLLLTPIFVPLAQMAGMDTVQLGLMMVVNLAMGLYTPPVGTTLFITSSIAKVKIGETVRAMVPFYLVALAVLLLISYVPALTIR